MTYNKESLKGRYIPQNPQKYRGDVHNIIYRSSLEMRFMRWCDINSNVLEWNSEEVVIPYRSPKDNAFHRYFVDFWIKIKNKTGEIKKHLVEVKPLRYTQPPVTPKRRTKNFISEVVQWGVNQAKWKAAREVAKVNGWEFTLITEQDLGLLTIPVAPFKRPHK